MQWTREPDGWIGHDDALGASCLVHYDEGAGLWCWLVDTLRGCDAGTELTEFDARSVAVDAMIEAAA